MTKKIKTAVLLAAGRGKRLRPHTDQTPKSLLPVRGRPTLDFVLVSAAKAGIKRVCIVTHHLGEKIEQYVEDGAAWGIDVVTCRQPRLDGTASALKSAFIAHPALFQRSQSFVLSATDYLFPPYYLSNLLDSHDKFGTDITISLKNMPRTEIVGRSTVKFQPNGRIARIIEKPSSIEIKQLVTASLTFVLPGAVIDYLSNFKTSPRGEYEVQSVINRMIHNGFSASGFVQPAPREWDESMM